MGSAATNSKSNKAQKQLHILCSSYFVLCDSFHRIVSYGKKQDGLAETRLDATSCGVMSGSVGLLHCLLGICVPCEYKIEYKI
jgi:hypothetical protein